MAKKILFILFIFRLRWQYLFLYRKSAEKRATHKNVSQSRLAIRKSVKYSRDRLGIAVSNREVKIACGVINWLRPQGQYAPL